MLSRLAAAAAVLATASLAAQPLAAAELPTVAPTAAVPVAPVLDADAATAHQYGYGDWYGGGWYPRRNRVGAGDVIGAVLVLGTIAAVASAATRATRDGRYRDYRDTPRYRYPDQRYDYRARQGDWRSDDSSRGIDRAVDMCAREIERGGPIDSVDGATRGADGWHVNGRLRTGASFHCSIDNDGRIRTIDYGQAGGRVGAANDQQWDDQRYAAARAAQDGAPAYPGGPIGTEAAQQP